MYTHFYSNGAYTGGVRLGILMLHSVFPRIIGEMGNAQTWGFPVQYEIVKGADVNSIVEGDARNLYTLFLSHAQQMVADGCTAITTNCGFLTVLQSQLSADLGVPVATSSLMQYPMICQFMPKNSQLGIVTINKKTLTPTHLSCAGIAPNTPIVGLENRREIHRVIMTPETTLNPQQAQQDVLDAVHDLQHMTPNLGAVLLECTNLSPYSYAVWQQFNLPVFDIVTLIRWFMGGLSPRYFNTPTPYKVRP